MLWQKIKEILKTAMPESAYTLWIEPLNVVKDGIQNHDKIIELAGPDRFFCSWVAENYLEKIRECLTTLGKTDVLIKFSFGPNLPIPSRFSEESGRKQQYLPSVSAGRSYVRTLHPRFTFDEFVVGDSNALAYSACEALAMEDSSLGNCLFVEGSTGLGKSHLTHAIAHHIMNNNPQTRLHYLTAQQLTAEMVKAIREQTMEKFKEKYHQQCDILLLEDVHSLTGRNKTQEELAVALDVLMEAGKRIIFTGVMPPRDIPELDQGIRSRMSSGLITTLNPPDLATRMKIIRRKARNSSLDLTDQVVEYLAERLKGDIRKVESAIVGLKAAACLRRTAPDLDMAKEAIANIVERQQELSPEMIRDFIAQQFKVATNDMQSKSRKKTIAFPRQVSMYLTRKHTDLPLSDIGRAFNRDHSTVVHSIRVITEALARSGSIRGQVDFLSEKLKERFSI